MKSKSCAKVEKKDWLSAFGGQYSAFLFCRILIDKNL